jgi:hypothetical protein
MSATAECPTLEIVKSGRRSIVEPFEEGRVLAQSDPREIDPLDDPNEVDFDDERDEDQLPLDVIEAVEAGVLLDDPERAGPTE